MGTIDTKSEEYQALPNPVKSAIVGKKIKDFISGQMVPAGPEEVYATQVFAHRLVEDYGYSLDQIQTRPQRTVNRNPSGSGTPYPIDIAVFKNAKKLDIDLYLVVECKKPTRKEGIKQLKIYMNMSAAEIGVWFNGKEHAYLHKIQTAKGIEYDDKLPNIPSKGQRVEDIGLFKRKDLKVTGNLITLFHDIRNKISQTAQGSTNDLQFAEIILNLLFCKLYDEFNTAQEYVVEFRAGYNESHVDVKKRIDGIFTKVKKYYPDIFDGTEKIDLDEESLAYVVGELMEWCVSDAERDVLGAAFEVFIGKALKGSQGQYFTPRNVVNCVVSILDPGKDDLILDPACGSGGFLVVALEHIWKKIEEEAKKCQMSPKWLETEKRKVAENTIHGIDKDSFLCKVTKAYLAIIGDGRAGIFCENSLKKRADWDSKTQNKIPAEVDIIITNVPFGADIAVEDQKILQNYDLGHKWEKDKKVKTNFNKSSKLHNKQPPQILFIEKCINLLKPGGKMAIVLPDGVLGGATNGYVPQFIRENTKILGIVDCTKDTFEPYTSTKVHILFLEKNQKQNKNKDYQIQVHNAVTCGHNSKAVPIPHDDFPLISECWQQFENKKRKKQDDKHFIISSKLLENNLYANRYSPTYQRVLDEIDKLEKTGDYTIVSFDEVKKDFFNGANVEGEDYTDAEKAGRSWIFQMYDKSPYRYLMTSSLTESGNNASTIKFITKKAYKKKAYKNTILKKGDIVMNRNAEKAGISAVVTGSSVGIMSCGFNFVLRVKKEYNPYYISAFLNSRLGRLQTMRGAFGTTIGHITQDDMLALRIVIPKDKSRLTKIADDWKKIAEKNDEVTKAYLNAFDLLK